MRSLSCWILKASRGAEVVLVGGKKVLSFRMFFLSDMITLLVPSFVKEGMYSYSNYTSREEVSVSPVLP